MSRLFTLRVVLPQPVQMVAGDGYSVVVGNDKTVKLVGTLGSGDEATTPTLIPGMPYVESVAAANQAIAAIDKDGAVWVYGTESATSTTGLGIPVGTSTTTAAQLPLPGPALAIWADGGRIFATTATGTFYWGLDAESPYTDIIRTPEPWPVPAGLDDPVPAGVTVTSSGGGETLYLMPDGRLFATVAPPDGDGTATLIDTGVVTIGPGFYETETGTVPLEVVGGAVATGAPFPEGTRVLGFVDTPYMNGWITESGGVVTYTPADGSPPSTIDLPPGTTIDATAPLLSTGPDAIQLRLIDTATGKLSSEVVSIGDTPTPFAPSITAVNFPIVWAEDTTLRAAVDDPVSILVVLSYGSGVTVVDTGALLPGSLAFDTAALTLAGSSDESRIVYFQATAYLPQVGGDMLESTRLFTLTIDPLPPVWVTDALAQIVPLVGYTGSALAAPTQLEAVSPGADVTYQGLSLPPGTSVTGDGLFGGTPTTPGIFGATFRATASPLDGSAEIPPKVADLESGWMTVYEAGDVVWDTWFTRETLAGETIRVPYFDGVQNANKPTRIVFSPESASAVYTFLVDGVAVGGTDGVGGGAAYGPGTTVAGRTVTHVTFSAAPITVGVAGAAGEVSVDVTRRAPAPTRFVTRAPVPVAPSDGTVTLVQAGDAAPVTSVSPDGLTIETSLVPPPQGTGTVVLENMGPLVVSFSAAAVVLSFAAGASSQLTATIATGPLPRRPVIDIVGDWIRVTGEAGPVWGYEPAFVADLVAGVANMPITTAGARVTGAACTVELAVLSGTHPIPAVPFEVGADTRDAEEDPYGFGIYAAFSSPTTGTAGDAFGIGRKWQAAQLVAATVGGDAYSSVAWVRIETPVAEHVAAFALDTQPAGLQRWVLYGGGAGAALATFTRLGSGSITGRAVTASPAAAAYTAHVWVIEPLGGSTLDVSVQVWSSGLPQTQPLARTPVWLTTDADLVLEDYEAPFQVTLVADKFEAATAVTYELVAGQLPPGFTFDPVTAILAGAPEYESGVYQFTITAFADAPTYARSATATANFRMRLANLEAAVYDPLQTRGLGILQDVTNIDIGTAYALPVATIETPDHFMSFAVLEAALEDGVEARKDWWVKLDFGGVGITIAARAGLAVVDDGTTYVTVAGAGLPNVFGVHVNYAAATTTIVPLFLNESAATFPGTLTTKTVGVAVSHAGLIVNGFAEARAFVPLDQACEMPVWYRSKVHGILSSPVPPVSAFDELVQSETLALDENTVMGTYEATFETGPRATADIILSVDPEAAPVIFGARAFAAFAGGEAIRMAISVPSRYVVGSPSVAATASGAVLVDGQGSVVLDMATIPAGDTLYAAVQVDETSVVCRDSAIPTTGSTGGLFWVGTDHVAEVPVDSASYYFRTESTTGASIDMIPADTGSLDYDEATVYDGDIPWAYFVTGSTARASRANRSHTYVYNEIKGGVFTPRAVRACRRIAEIGDIFAGSAPPSLFLAAGDGLAIVPQTQFTTVVDLARDAEKWSMLVAFVGSRGDVVFDGYTIIEREAGSETVLSRQTIASVVQVNSSNGVVACVVDIDGFVLSQMLDTGMTAWTGVASVHVSVQGDPALLQALEPKVAEQVVVREPRVVYGPLVVQDDSHIVARYVETIQATPVAFTVEKAGGTTTYSRETSYMVDFADPGIAIIADYAEGAAVRIDVEIMTVLETPLIDATSVAVGINGEGGSFTLTVLGASLTARISGLALVWDGRDGLTRASYRPGERLMIERSPSGDVTVGYEGDRIPVSITPSSPVFVDTVWTFTGGAHVSGVAVYA